MKLSIDAEVRPRVLSVQVDPTTEEVMALALVADIETGLPGAHQTHLGVTDEAALELARQLLARVLVVMAVAP